MLIEFCAPMEAVDENNKEIQIPDSVIEALSGRENEDPDCELSQYLSDSHDANGLKEAGVQDGILHFKTKAGKLWICARYNVDSELDEKQVRKLMEYTSGQFSDGAGAGWTQDLWYEFEIGLDPVWDQIERQLP
ncbi:hypothetical protein [Alcanivorax sediminis]|uniref:Uncharacterized protein n=1 Tax=Alcanivorax sediminis TaxID=2663008 RepID=A0A6N7LVX3_9GAMM|nr:hypothetical protein [Alcanivorax sediminis]MQX52280.1 hypothetical protein [Alcanivorax sediminis]